MTSPSRYSSRGTRVGGCGELGEGRGEPSSVSVRCVRTRATEQPSTERELVKVTGCKLTRFFGPTTRSHFRTGHQRRHGTASRLRPEHGRWLRRAAALRLSQFDVSRPGMCTSVPENLAVAPFRDALGPPWPWRRFWRSSQLRRAVLGGTGTTSAGARTRLSANWAIIDDRERSVCLATHRATLQSDKSCWLTRLSKSLSFFRLSSHCDAA